MRSRLVLVVCAAILQACVPGPESAIGFRLPDGDAGRGLEAFEALQCHACHIVDGLDLPLQDARIASVRLGGDVARVKTYGELVTSIINPSHKLAPGYKGEEVSLMELAYLNDVMTVRQLIDLVAFLEARYNVVPPEYNPYWYVYP